MSTSQICAEEPKVSLDPMKGQNEVQGQGKTLKKNCSWEQMIERLLELFSHPDQMVNVEEVEEVLASYQSDPADWKRFAKFDKFKYTRNLVHEGNGNFNLMILCWDIGNQSSIHDHTSAHCFVKVLAGQVYETKYYWPSEKVKPDGSMAEKEVSYVKTNQVTYMSDELGLHRIGNDSHSDKAVTLHLYCPPFSSCQVFDERTGKVMKCPMTFWSKFGERQQQLRK